MELDRLERAVRRAGTAAVIPPLLAICLGVWRGLARPKGQVSGRGGAALLNSRLFYASAAVLEFAVLARLWRPLAVSPSTCLRALAVILGSLLYFPGLALVLWSRLALGPNYFVSTALGAELYADHHLVTSGPYAAVRHPLYVGIQLAGLGALLLYRTRATLLIALSAAGLPLRAQREEQVLADRFGEEWQVYCHRVPAWFPRLQRQRRQLGSVRMLYR